MRGKANHVIRIFILKIETKDSIQFNFHLIWCCLTKFAEDRQCLNNVYKVVSYDKYEKPNELDY